MHPLLHGLCPSTNHLTIFWCGLRRADPVGRLAFKCIQLAWWIPKIRVPSGNSWPLKACSDDCVACNCANTSQLFAAKEGYY
jgi:hypothetical protein